MSKGFMETFSTKRKVVFKLMKPEFTRVAKAYSVGRKGGDCGELGGYWRLIPGLEELVC